MPLNARIEATAPSTSPTSAAPHYFAFETTRTATNDPIFRVYRGAVDAANLVFEIDKDGDLTAVGDVDGVDIAAFKTAYDAFVSGENERIDDRVAALLTAGATITLTYDDAAGTLTIASTDEKVAVKHNGTLVGTRAINFIDGSGVTLTVADDSANGEVDITIAASGGAGTGTENTWTARQNFTSTTAGAIRLQAAATATDGGMTNSPTVRFTGTYDSDTTAGITSAEHNLEVRYTMTAAGASPTGKLSFLNHAGTEVASLSSAGALTLTTDATLGSAGALNFGDTNHSLYRSGANLTFRASGVVRHDIGGTVYFTWESVGQYIGNASGAPSGTNYLYASAGELYWKGSSGTVTKLAVA